MTKSGFIIFLALVTFALTAAVYVFYRTYQEDYVQSSAVQPAEKASD